LCIEDLIFRHDLQIDLIHHEIGSGACHAHASKTSEQDHRDIPACPLSLPVFLD
jgi:hypothetical protein